MNINFSTFNSLSNADTQGNKPVFGNRGKPLNIERIIKNHNYLLPQRVEAKIKELLNQGVKDIKLRDVHLATYAPLLDCESLEEAKKMFPEFSIINDRNVKVGRTVVKENAKLKIDNNFILNVLKEYWGKLKNKETIASDFGLSGRWALEKLLQGSNFIGFSHNYPNLVKASYEEGYMDMASKTRAWNEANPEKRRELNKHAAQGCKTEEYKKEQSQRIIEYDIEHPERIEKISAFSKEMWGEAIEVKQAMAAFIAKQPTFVRAIVTKQQLGKKLTETEKRIVSIYYNNFWKTHPHLKTVLSQAVKRVNEKRKIDK